MLRKCGSEELSSQAQLLKGMVEGIKFNLSKFYNNEKIFKY